MSLALLGAVALALSICPTGPRDNCVVDGDTFWLAGEKIRVADIDAPEMDGRCPYESQHARKARQRLLTLLNAGNVTLRREGQDRYGRTLAVILRGNRSIGDMLVSEGLARTWNGRREPWC